MLLAVTSYSNLITSFIRGFTVQLATAAELCAS